MQYVTYTVVFHTDESSVLLTLMQTSHKIIFNTTSTDIILGIVSNLLKLLSHILVNQIRCNKKNDKWNLLLLDISFGTGLLFLIIFGKLLVLLIFFRIFKVFCKYWRFVNWYPFKVTFWKLFLKIWLFLKENILGRYLTIMKN